MSRLLLLAVLLLAAFWPQRADAANCLNTGDACTYSQAYAMCEADKATRPVTGGANVTYAYRCQDGTLSYVVLQRQATENGTAGSWGNIQIFRYTGPAACPAGEEVAPGGGCICSGGYSRDATGQCMNEQKCKALPPLASGTFTTGSMSGTACQSGCQMVSIVSVCSGTGGQTMCTVGGAKGSGAACTASDKPPTAPKPQECIPAGSGQTLCVKPDGQECYTASSGRQICWKPGETGEKDDGPVKQKRDAGTQPIQPNVNLPNGDTLTPSGTPTQTNTQVKDGSGTRNITTVTQNYSTTNGTNAGGSNQGQNGDGTGGEGDGDGDGEGSPGEGVGDLYDGEGKTVGDVFGEFKNRVTNAPIAGAGTQFLTVSIGGSCPVWTVPATAYWDAMVFDFHCSQTMTQAFAWGAALLMAVAAFVAFKWGFL